MQNGVAEIIPPFIRTFIPNPEREPTKQRKLSLVVPLIQHPRLFFAHVMQQLEVAGEVIRPRENMGCGAARDGAPECVLTTSSPVLPAFKVTLIVSPLRPCVVTIRVFAWLAIVPAHMTPKGG